MKEIESEGRTVTIAVESALKELGLRRDQVEVTVLDEGNAGILGFGQKAARVQVREKRWGDASAAPEAGAPSPSADKPSVRARLSSARPAGRRPAPRPAARPAEQPRQAAPEPRHESPAPRRERSPEPARAERRDARPPRGGAPRNDRRPRRDDAVPLTAEEQGKAVKAAEEVLSELMRLAGVPDAKVTAKWDSAQSRVQAELQTEDAGLVVGKDGRTLEALQFLTTILAGRRAGVSAPLQVECDGWWKDLEARIAADADRAALEVAESGHPFRFEPMEAALRRIIHRRLAENPEVETASEGEGSWRKVVIRPKRR